MDEIRLVVIGGLNTDIIGQGLSRLPKSGELTKGENLVLGPGGKSRNIASMAGHLLPKGHVAMVGRTTDDTFGLWKVPLSHLEASGVSTQFVKVVPFAEHNKMPAIVLIPVDRAGNSEIMLFPGTSLVYSLLLKMNLKLSYKLLYLPA